MSNVIPFIADAADFNAIPEIRCQSWTERHRRIRHRILAIADAFPASVKVLGMHKQELVALLEEQRASNNIPADFFADFTAAARHARAVAEMIENARLRIAIVLDVPVYEDDDEDGGGVDAA
jgi:hypothetical protein